MTMMKTHPQTFLVSFSLYFFFLLVFQGISLRSQELYLVVFLTRYLDLFTTFYSLYNSVMKVFYIVSTASVVYAVRCIEPTASTYQRTQDAQTLSYGHALGVPAVVVFFHYALFGVNSYFFSIELLRSYSIVLESIAMVPQLLLFKRDRNGTSITARRFIGLMGLYRFFYILNWIYRSHTERNYRHHYLVYVSGVIQCLLYYDFWTYHFKAWCRNGCCGVFAGREQQQSGNTTAASAGQGDAPQQQQPHPDNEAVVPLLDDQDRELFEADETELVSSEGSPAVTTSKKEETATTAGTEEADIQVV